MIYLGATFMSLGGVGYLSCCFLGAHFDARFGSNVNWPIFLAYIAGLGCSLGLWIIGLLLMVKVGGLW